MIRRSTEAVLRHVRTLLDRDQAERTGDAELLQRFVAGRDEAATGTASSRSRSRVYFF